MLRGQDCHIYAAGSAITPQALSKCYPERQRLFRNHP